MQVVYARCLGELYMSWHKLASGQVEEKGVLDFFGKWVKKVFWQPDKGGPVLDFGVPVRSFFFLGMFKRRTGT